MKRTYLYFTVSGMLIMILFFSSCSPVTAGAGQIGQEQSNTTTQSVLSIDYPNALPAGTQLALGIFKLDEVNNPISKEQAAAILPLWKAYRSLTRSDTSAAQEIDGLISQIQQTLTSDQLNAIAAMQLTGQDLAKLAQQKDLTMGGNPGLNFSPEQQATRQALRANGQSRGNEGGFRFEGGGGGFGPGGGGFGPPPGLEQTPGALQTAVAQRGGFVGSSRVNPALVEALIGYLNTIAQ